MKAWKIAGAVALAASLGGVAFAQTGGPIKIANVGELSGTGATSAPTSTTASSSRSRRSTPQAASSAARSRSPHADTQSQSRHRARRSAQKARRRGRLRRHGPGVLRLDHRQHGRDAAGRDRPISPAARRPSITQQGNPYIFRTSFTQTTAMPKVARYIEGQRQGEERRDDLGQQRLRQGRPRHDHQGARRSAASRSSPTSRPTRARSISPPPCVEGEAGERRRAVRLHQRGRVGARICASCASRATTSRSSARRRSPARR